MSNELMVIEVTDDMAPVVYVAGGLDKYFDMVKDAVSGEVPDLTTKKGRDRIASLAAQVSRSKTAVEKPGRAYLKRLKEMPKTVEAELREWVNNCDNLRDEVHRPLTEWEDEQKLIEAERIAAEEAERLRIQIESDHEIALLMNEKFDREREEERKAAEAAMVERDRKLQEEAAERARAEEAAKQQAERDRVDRERVEAIQREEAAIKQAQAAEAARVAAEEKAIADAEIAEKRRIEAGRQALIAAEAAALAAVDRERKRIKEAAAAAKEEYERRAADIAHRRTVNSKIKSEIIALGLSDEQAIVVIKAMVNGNISNVKITY